MHEFEEPHQAPGIFEVLLLTGPGDLPEILKVHSRAKCRSLSREHDGTAAGIAVGGIERVGKLPDHHIIERITLLRAVQPDECMTLPRRNNDGRVLHGAQGKKVPPYSQRIADLRRSRMAFGMLRLEKIEWPATREVAPARTTAVAFCSLTPP